MTKGKSDNVNTRNLVVDILLAVTRDGEFSHIAIRDVLDKYRYLPKQDRAFITRLSQGTIERMIELDAIINQFSKTKVKKMKPVIAAILRSGVYQLKYMDSVPDSAACNEAVKLTVKRGFGGLKGFVNGVMRNIARNMEQIRYPDARKEPVSYLSVKYSVPEWLVQRFTAQYGAEACEKSLAAYLMPHPTSVQVDTHRISMDEIMDSLEKQGVTVTRNPQVERALFLSGYEALDEIEEFENGLLYVQDTASMLAVELAAPRPGDTVIDVCAAPGGKSVYAARMIGAEGHVEARDLTDYKVEMIEDNIDRCQLSNMTAKVWDARVFDEAAEEKADVIIADLPCSGLGVIGTKTDIKYNASEEKIAELAALQQEILDVVCRYVRPEGTLLYSTCTMTKEENEDNVQKFLESHEGFELEQMRQYFPYEGCDGFFMAKMRRR
ncbi:16S rRNA (cytosine(967)-C(5))-methyltransferase RsmB [uncultured Eubacterium sp.]|uniref:16S rRNA (cytosine(967)-C(5))-methyltransferase RsmB n=1 Tax=uncultured Eubacterium sp. TaxID=165185 RepID=UPI0025F24B8E|nr:16S rRNA (cytosine(967)-C(5))-methyltransferase RsmB [uncultured Eubacterium sp.]